MVPLSFDAASAQNKIALDDVVLVHLVEGKNKAAARAELRVRPQVQGMVVALENKTGRILAMTGGFSYPLSQLNRATQARAAAGLDHQAAELSRRAGAPACSPIRSINDSSITLPPINGGHSQNDFWTPKNYDGGGGGVMTMRSALENSSNLATVHLLQGGIDAKPDQSLQRLCELALEAQIYKDCIHFYPFVLGAEPVRPIDLVAFYAAIANEGVRPTPHVIDSIERDGHTIYRYDTNAGMSRIKSVDQVAFYQLKTMMQGVLARGTARAIADFSSSVAGKTGTSDDENDAWFVGFSNEVTVAVWIGYDNAGNKRRTLGGGATGGGVAVPIFEPVMRAVWNDVTPGPRSPRLRPRPNGTSAAHRPTSRSRMPAHRQQGQSHRHDELRWKPVRRPGRYAKRGDERAGATRTRRSTRSPTSIRAASAHGGEAHAPQWSGSWGGGNGWYGAATQPTTTGWNYRW